MAITVEARTEIIKLVVGMFGAAPGASVLSSLVAAYESGSSISQIAANLANTNEFTGIYPTFLTSGEFATKLVNNLLTEASVEAKAEAVTVLTAALNGGMSRSVAFVEAIKFVDGVAATDAAFGTSGAAFDNKVAVAIYYSVDSQKSGSSLADLQGVVSNVTSAPASVTSAKTEIDGTLTVGQTFTLTTSATDVVTGTTNADTIIGQLGQSTTLQASDKINGGLGADTFRIVTDAPLVAAAGAVSGFTVTGVETIEVQAQNANGSTIGLENVSAELETVRSSSSSQALTLDQVKKIVALEINNTITPTGGAAPGLTVTYQPTVVSGTADTQKLSLNGNAMGALNIAGIETLAITSTGAASTLASVVDSSLTTVTAAGDQKVTITAALPTTVKTVTSTQTAGGLTVTAGVADVSVTGGAGDDKVTFTGSFTSADSFNGGAGRDTVVANMAEYTATVASVTYAAAAKLSNVEIIEIADQLSANFDASKITGEDTYTLSAGFATSTISGVTSGTTFNLNAASAGQTLTVPTATSLNLVIGSLGTPTVPVDGIGNVGTIAAAAATSLTVASNGISAVADSTKTTANTLALTAAAATSVTVTGNEDLTLTMTGTALKTFDASATTGQNNYAVTFASGATISGGSGTETIGGSAGADVITGGAGNDSITGNGGADTITGGAGNDTFAYAALADSSGTTVDTITDFTSGADKFSFTALAASVGRTAITLKGGSAANFGSAQAAIALNSGVTQVVYQADTNTLWVDVNDDGTLNANDLQIKLPSTITAVTAADVGQTAAASSSGSFTLTAGYDLINATAASVGAGLSTAAPLSASLAGTAGTAPTLNQSLSVTTTLANLTNLDTLAFGTATTDTLTFTDGGALTINTGVIGAAAVTGLDVIQLANAVNTITYTKVAATGETLKGGSSQDIITVATASGITDIQSGAGGDILTYTTTVAAGSKLDMGAGDDSLSLSLAADLSAFATVNGGDGADKITFSAGVTIADNNFTKVASVETLALTGANTVSLGANALASGIRTLTLGAAATTLNAGYGASATLTVDATTLADGVALTIGATSSGAVNVTNLIGDISVTAGSSTTSSVGVVSAAATATDTAITAYGSTGALTLTGGLSTKTMTIGGGTAVADGAGTINASGFAGQLNITYADQVSNAVSLVAGTAAVTVAGDASDTITVTGLASASQNFTGTVSKFVVTATAGTHLITTAGLADSITGGSGADTISSGAGNDTLTGNGGADVFRMESKAHAAAAAGANVKSITDFTTTVDKINFTSGGAANAVLEGLTLAGTTTAATFGTAVTDATSVATLADVYTAIGANASFLAGTFAASTAAASGIVAKTVTFANGAAAGTYLVVNDSTAAFQGANDIVIKVVGTVVAADLSFTA